MTPEPDDVFDQIERDVLAARDAVRDLAGSWRELTLEVDLALVARDCSQLLKSERVQSIAQVAERLGIDLGKDKSLLTVEGTMEQIKQQIESMFEGRQ
jgi:hypothetical protein